VVDLTTSEAERAIENFWFTIVKLPQVDDG
jgi:hypothetical protein